MEEQRFLLFDKQNLLSRVRKIILRIVDDKNKITRSMLTS